MALSEFAGMPSASIAKTPACVDAARIVSTRRGRPLPSLRHGENVVGVVVGGGDDVEAGEGAVVGGVVPGTSV